MQETVCRMPNNRCLRCPATHSVLIIPSRPSPTTVMPGTAGVRGPRRDSTITFNSLSTSSLALLRLNQHRMDVYAEPGRATVVACARPNWCDFCVTISSTLTRMRSNSLRSRVSVSSFSSSCAESLALSLSDTRTRSVNISCAALNTSLSSAFARRPNKNNRTHI